MPQNHPWNTKSSAFTCPPNCPERKPACQDHCEKHIREKAEHERKMAEKRLKKHIDGYSAHAITGNRDITAKRSRRSSGRYGHGFE